MGQESACAARTIFQKLITLTDGGFEMAESTKNVDPARNYHTNLWTQSCLCVVILVSLLYAWSGSQAIAQAYPSRSVRVVVPTTPGGSLDLISRLVAQKLSESWTHGVVVDNRAGAGGVIGTDAVAKAVPDGYTVGFVASQFTISASVYNKLPYDSVRDFAPVTQLASAAWVLVANPSLPVHTIKELIVLAKKQPGRINYASTGNGGSTHLAAELLKSMTGINLIHIPYKGTVPAVNDVIGGQVELTIAGLTAVMPQVASGRLRLLGTVGSKRSAVVPDLPTIGETVPGYFYDNWFGVLAPRGTPAEIVNQLRDSIARALQTPEIKSKLLAQSIYPMGTSSAQFGDVIREEIAKYTKLAKEIGIKVDE